MSKEEFLALWADPSHRNLVNKAMVERVLFGKQNNVLNPLQIAKQGLTDRNFEMLQDLGVVGFMQEIKEYFDRKAN